MISGNFIDDSPEALEKLNPELNETQRRDLIGKIQDLLGNHIMADIDIDKAQKAYSKSWIPSSNIPLKELNKEIDDFIVHAALTFYGESYVFQIKEKDFNDFQNKILAAWYAKKLFLAQERHMFDILATLDGEYIDRLLELFANREG